MGLPTGTVTFLFTDIEGSTTLLLKGEEQYAQLLADHRQVLRAAFARHRGHEVDTQGDAFFVAFSQPGDAVAAASEAQRELAVPVRMGIHTGEARVSGEGYVGVTVHEGARIAHAAHGGQIVLSGATRALLDDGDELRDLGEHRLKDVAPQRLFQVGTTRFPPLRTLSQTNLPPQPTRFVGRERELDEIANLLRQDDVRLLTLTGPGGVGKTRLALQAAAGAVDELIAGAWFASLAAERDAARMRTRIAAALGLGSAEMLTGYLAERELLLVLDNLEQIDGAGEVVSDLLRAGPAVRVLATSREPLNINAEHEYQVPPLSAAEAVELFSRRARAVNPRLVAEVSRPTIEQICARLDGLPLAIELAAARTKILSPAALLERLERALPLLKTGLTDVPERQRTLAATIGWSYELLSPGEQKFFRRLAVFAATFSVEGAAAVAASELDPLETIAGLVDKSLLVPTEDGHEPRFRLLRTIGEFAEARLGAEDDEAAAWRRLAHYLARRARELEALHGIGSGAIRYHSRADYPNVVAALRWMYANDQEAFVRLLADGWAQARAGVPRDELEALAAAALERVDDSDMIGRFHLLTILSSVRRRRGDIEGALAAADERIKILDGIDDPDRLAFARNERGAFLNLRHDFEAAEEEFELAADLFARAGNSDMAAVARGNATDTRVVRDRDFAGALHRFEAIEANSGEVACMTILLGDLERGARLAEKAYETTTADGRGESAAYCLNLLSAVAQKQGNCRVAARFIGASDQHLRDLGIDMPYTNPLERELFAETRARVEDVLGEREFARLSAEGAELVRTGRHNELVGELTPYA